MAFVNAGQMASLSKAGFDALMSSVLTNLDGALTQAQQIQAFLTAHPDADFTAVTGSGPTGYAAGDVTNFKSAFVDADKLRQIYQGLTTQATTYDFRTFIKLLITGVH